LKNKFKSLLLFALLITFTYVFYLSSTNAHHYEWTAVKIYPSIALANGFDLYQTTSSPYLLTMYGPGSPIFYLFSSFGSTPETCFFIASFLNIAVLLLLGWSLFGNNRSDRISCISLCFGFTWLFVLFLDKTTHTLFRIHHDLPVFAYLFIGSFCLLRKSSSYQTLALWVGSLFLWLAFWTKIVALPWLFLPFVFKFIQQRNSIPKPTKSWSGILIAIVGTGCLSFFFFSSLFGATDLWFHLFESTNSYPWRESLTLFGSTQEKFVPNEFSAKISVLLRIVLLYFIEYWWITLSCMLIWLYQLKKRRGLILLWLVACYFMVLPACLSSLAKFGGVENSLVFAHAPAYAALLLQVGKIIDKLVSSEVLKISIAFVIALLPAMGSIRIAKAIWKDTSQSPQQLAYEYLVENPEDPVYFALSPLPNYLANGKIWDSGEALTYSTMMTPDALPSQAGMEGPLEIPLVAFGSTPYSKSFFEKKFNLVPVVSPPKLKDWSLYRATPKSIHNNP
jgi:hypothetical protein